MEVWEPLYPDYPNYSVSSYGLVRNNATGRILAQSKNNTGYMKVAIYDYAGVRRTVEVTRLVASVFVAGQDQYNTTPIHLDGNKEHTFADNLAWRPRWFAAHYHRQFRDDRYHIRTPLVETTTGRWFEDSLEAARAFGLLEQHVMLSTVNGSPVHPGEYVFRLRDL